MIRSGLPLLALLALAPWVAPAPAQAQINRCTAPDGTSIYTDRSCSELGAVERLPRTQGGQAPARAYRGGCARSVHELIHEMTWAIDNRDVNRLAAVYHWPGTSTRTGYNLMDRLDRIARSPLVDIVAMRPAEPVTVTRQAGIGATFASTLPRPDASAPPQAATAAQRRPVALRVQQTAGDSGVPTRTVFNLRQHIGCWWVSL